MISIFKSCKSPVVDRTASFDEIFNMVVNPSEEVKKEIVKLRTLNKGSEGYSQIKESLPTVRFNYQFKAPLNEPTKGIGAHIVANTGLLYIDVDEDVENFKNNRFVYASWKSSGGKGYTVVVKVNCLPIETDSIGKEKFKQIYLYVAELIGVKADAGACKQNQQTILSYDENAYLNTNSEEVDCVSILSIELDEVKKVSNTLIRREEKDLYEGMIPFQKDEYIKVRHNNIEDYFKDNPEEPYIYFSEKESIIQPFIPKRIEDGKRNVTFVSVLGNYAYLNKTINAKYLTSIANTINDHCVNKYTADKIKSIVDWILSEKKEGNLKGYANKERRIIFNPEFKMTRKEKMTIVNKENGEAKREQTLQKIYNTIEDWDFNKMDKITMAKIAKESMVSLITVKRYFSSNPELKTYIKELNSEFKALSK